MYTKIKLSSKVIFSFFLLQLFVFNILYWGGSFAQAKEAINLSAKQKNFLNSMYSEYQPVFAKIQAQRDKIKLLQKNYNQKGLLSNEEGAWLQQTAVDYKYLTFNYQVNDDWVQLLQRVDTVPNSLLIAQATIESAWGTSRFAVQGNAYFGQRCSVNGCGLKALEADFLTKKFASKQASIEAYVWNLNTHGAYASFRKERALMRNNKKDVDSIILAKQLIAYAEAGQGYLNEIVHTIQVLQLQKHYDGKKAS